MIPIILIGIGIIIMLRKRVSLSQTLELRRPRTYILGAIIIITAIIINVIALLRFNDDIYTTQELVYDVIPFIIPLISIAFLKQPKLNPVITGSDKKHTSPTVTIIGWIIILGSVGVLIYALLQ